MNKQSEPFDSWDFVLELLLGDGLIESDVFVGPDWDISIGVEFDWSLGVDLTETSLLFISSELN